MYSLYYLYVFNLHEKGFVWRGQEQSWEHFLELLENRKLIPTSLSILGRKNQNNKIFTKYVKMYSPVL